MNTLKDKRVAVIGDDDLVCKAIKRALHCRLHIALANLGGCDGFGLSGGRAADCDLIIVAIATEDGEPLAELAAAHLIDEIGKVPLLVVSSHPFETGVEFGISHFRYPFEPDQLCARVQGLLMSRSAKATAARGIAAAGLLTVVGLMLRMIAIL